jgi:phage tail sheath gpL-like
MTPPLNPDLPSSWLIPGIYLSLDLSGAPPSVTTVPKRLLLVGHKTDGGIATLNTIVQLNGPAAALLWFGRGSEVLRLFNAARAQIGGGVADIYGLAVPEPVGGVQSNHLVTFVGTAKATSAIELLICGYRVPVPVAAGDAPSTIAAAAVRAVRSVDALPVQPSSVGPTLWLTYRVRGRVGNDLPIIVNTPVEIGVKASPGTITFEGRAAGAGAVALSIGAKTIQIELADGDTGEAVASRLALELNRGANPCSAQASGAVMTLEYVRDRVVHRIAVEIFGSTGLTARLAVGTVGEGAPQVGAALAQIAAQSAFPCWVSAFDDAATLGPMAEHIETQANGRIQKDQQLFVGSTEALAIAGRIPTSSTPALTSSPRYAVAWCPDSPQQAYELAARAAARVCVEDFHPYNYNGEPLSTRDGIPLLLPHPSARPDADELNAALRSYFLTPLVTDEQGSRLTILRDRTTANATDERLWAWGTMRSLAFYRRDLAAFLRSRFSQKNIKLFGTPRTPRTVSLTSIRDAVFERVRSWDNADLFDGADDLKTAIQVAPNANTQGRVDIFVPCRPPRKLDQLSGVAALV